MPSKMVEAITRALKLYHKKAFDSAVFQFDFIALQRNGVWEANEKFLFPKSNILLLA